jgi:hypothetical protein
MTKKKVYKQRADDAGCDALVAAFSLFGDCDPTPYDHLLTPKPAKPARQAKPRPEPEKVETVGPREDGWALLEAYG